MIDTEKVASERVVSRALKVPEQELHSAVDPVLNIHGRRIIDRPAPESVNKMI